MANQCQAVVKINNFNLLIGTILIVVKPTVKLDQIKKALQKQEELEEKGERKRIGEILIEMDVINQDNLELSLRLQKFIKTKAIRAVTACGGQASLPKWLYRNLRGKCDTVARLLQNGLKSG